MGETATTAIAHPEETRELAYQLWAFIAGRNAARVAALLAQDHDTAVPERTVQYWANHYNWAQRASEDVARIAPDLRYQAFSELLFAGLDGARYIRRVNAGEEQPDKVRAQLAIAAVDRIGFSPVGKGDPTTAIAPPSDHKQVTAEDISGLSPDDLLRMEQNHRSRRSRT